MNGLLKINVPQFIFLILSYIFAQNKPLFTYFSSIFLKIVLKINVRLVYLGVTYAPSYHPIKFHPFPSCLDNSLLSMQMKYSNGIGVFK